MPFDRKQPAGKLLFYKSQQKIIDNTPSHDVLLLRKARQKDQRPPPINTQKLKDPKVMRTFQQKVQNKFSLFMIKSNEIDLETINDVLYENGQQILGPKKKRNKERILDNTWKKVEQRKEKIKKRFCQLNL